MCGMDWWEVQRRGRVKRYRAERIRRKVARGKLMGESRVRPVGGDDWRPLREVPHLCRPPAPWRAAGDHGGRWGEVQGLIWHVGIYAGVCWFFHLPTWAWVGWGIGVASHVLGAVPRIIRGAPQLPEKPAEAQGGAAAAEAPAESLDRDPFLAELAMAIADLERIASSRQLTGVDLKALRASAEDLRRRHLQLSLLAEPKGMARLAEERDRALAQAAQATDPRTVEALQAQAQSVGERLGSLKQAGEAAARLEARERTLLHQVESLRLELARSGADEAMPTDLAAEVKRLQADVQATAEVEAHLARARLGARAQPT
jgi:hypothetical protein